MRKPKVTVSAFDPQRTVQVGKSRRRQRAILNAACLGTSAAAAGLSLWVHTAPTQAATHTYSFNATTTTDWSTGQNWNGTIAPISAPSTELRFGFSDLNRPSSGLTYQLNNDISGWFNLNVFTIQADANSTTSATVNFNSTGGSSGLAFVADGAATPTMNLTANRNSTTVTVNYNINTPVSLSSGLLVQGNGTANYTIAGPISGSGKISKYGNSVLSITGTNNNTADVAVYGGGIRATDGVGLNAASRLILDGGVFVGNGAATFNRTIGTGAGQLSFGANGGGFAAIGGALTVQLNGGSSPVTWGTSGFLADGAALRFGTTTANNTTDFRNGIDVNGAVRNIVVTSGGSVDYARLSGAITDSATGGGISKSGNGMLTLTGASTYAGPTEVRAGTLALNGATGSLNSASALRFNGGGTFMYDNTGATGAVTQTFSALNFVSGEGTARTNRVANGNLTVTLGGLTRSTGASGVILNGGSSTSTLNSRFVISGQAAGFIDPGLFYGIATGPTGSNFAWYDAAGYVRAINYQTDSGATSVTGGLALTSSTHARTAATITAQGTDTFTTISLLNNTNTMTGFTLGGGALVTTNAILRSGGGSGGFTTTIGGGDGIRAGTDQELIIRTDNNGDILRFDTPIVANGTNNLVKSGTGIVNLMVGNTYTGTTYVNAGSLIIFTPSSGKVINGNVIINGGILQGGTSGSTATEAIASTSNVTVNSGGFRWLRSTQTINNFVQFDGSSGVLGDAALAQVNVNNTTLSGGTLTIGANNSGAWNTNSLTMNGGLVNISYASNNGSRFLTVGSGGLQITQPDGGGLYTPITLTNYIASSSSNLVFSLQGDVTYTPSATNTEGSAIYATGSTTDQMRLFLVGTRTFNIGNGIADADLIIRPRISSTGATSGLVKTGAGTLQLEGSNTYTGATTVNGGLLRINGSISTSSTVVNNNGTLGGTGTTGAVNVQAGGKIAPGPAGVGTLTTGVVTVAGAAKFGIQVDTTANTADKLLINNGATVINLGTEAILELDTFGNATGAYNGSFVILENTGAGELNGSFAGLTPDGFGIATFTSDYVNYTLNYNYIANGDGNTNDVLLTFSSVPEPASMSLFGLAGAALLKRRRRGK